MKAYERLIQYARIHTASVENANTTPSAARQFDLARILEHEMRSLDVQDVFVDEHCFVYGLIPATAGYENKTAIGFLPGKQIVQPCGHAVSQTGVSGKRSNPDSAFQTMDRDGIIRDIRKADSAKLSGLHRKASACNQRGTLEQR